MDIISHFKIRDRVKNWEELLTWLRPRVDLVEMSLVPSNEERLRKNVFHSYLNEPSGFSPEDFVFSCYQLPDTPRNAEYNKPLLAVNLPLAHITFEHRTGYFECNSSRLFLELDIERGITRENFEAQALLFKIYSTSVKQYLAHEY